MISFTRKSKFLKNLILGSFFIFITSSFSINPKPNLVRPWWKTAIVDAAGALGGAGSVASIGSVACATPPGWIALGAGALVGGAGASLAMVVPNDGSLTMEQLNATFSHAENTNNDLDNIGAKHNELIIGFANSNLRFNSSNFINYIKSLNIAEYNEALKTINKSYLDNEFNAIRGIDDIDEALAFVSTKLPNDVNKEVFLSDLRTTLNSTTERELISAIRVMETKNYGSGNTENCSILSLKAFYSTLRYSAALWK